MSSLIKENWKGVSFLVVFILLSLYFSYYLFSYYVGIFCVNPGEVGELIWCSSGPGTFFPFPKESGYEAAISYSYSMIDYILFFLLIATNLVYVIPIFSWIISLTIAFQLLKKYRISIN